MLCPECREDKICREWRQCPRHGSEPVCIDCCKRCDLYDPDPKSLYTCRYPVEEEYAVSHAVIREL